MNKNIQNILFNIEQYIDNQFKTNEPNSLYEPIRYIMSLGGKRIRPLLCILASQLYKTDYQKVIPSAYAIELFHNFSLVHDDIMDNAPLRRGLPTLHEKYDTNTGILSGDVMLIYVYEYLLKNADNQATNIISIFNKTSIEVCEGQQMDMDFEKSNSIKIADYLKMIELKTAVLLGAALQIGGILGGANESDSNCLYQFGFNIGIAFQIQDDILDTFGDPTKFGKKVGGDISNHKKTLLHLLALQNANDFQISRINKAYDHEEEQTKIQSVTAIFKELNVQQLALEYQQNYYKIAFDYLEKVNVDKDKKQDIIQLATNLFNREN